MWIFSYINKHRVLLAVIIFITVVGASFGVRIKSANAVAGAATGLAVGGDITAMSACTCGYTAWLGALYLVIKGRGYWNSGTYVYSALLTDLHSNFMIRPGSVMKGLYLPGVQACWMQAGYICIPYGNRGLLTTVGIGLAP